jgi:putative SOS response-associated peptidase YedK
MVESCHEVSMCNLYSIRSSRAALARKFHLSDNRMVAFDALPAIFPGHMAPIIKQSADGERELVLRSWGFILLREGYAPKRVTNARDDKIETKFWKDSFVTRRCLVPATAFCEPDEGKPARWHWFALSGEEERPLFAFAGIYRQWKGPIKKASPNVDIEVFPFMTTLPNALTTTINHERSPVLLDGRRAGEVTSAAFGATVGAPVGLAWVHAEVPLTPTMLDATGVHIEVRGDPLPAVASIQPFYDPEGLRLRM